MEDAPKAANFEGKSQQELFVVRWNAFLEGDTSILEQLRDEAVSRAGLEDVDPGYALLARLTQEDLEKLTPGIKESMERIFDGEGS